MIRVLLNGAAGKMGRAMGAGILGEEDMQLVAVVDKMCVGHTFADLSGCCCAANELVIEEDLATALKRTQPDVMLDFTSPQAVKGNLITALSLSVPCVVGTTGLSDADLAELEQLALQHDVPLFVAPNFTLSAILMMRFAAEAAKYFPHYEIFEMHSEGKLDAPSGTALHSARLMEEQRGAAQIELPDVRETIPGSRGGNYAETHIHSVRLPGFVAKQDIIFGGLGQRLTIGQENISREGFFPGVALALRSIGQLKGLTVGLEHLL